MWNCDSSCEIDDDNVNKWLVNITVCTLCGLSLTFLLSHRNIKYIHTMPLHDWSLARDVVIISRRYYANSTGYSSESVSSPEWHVWFASRCPGKRIFTWQMIAASCPTALDALRSADVPTCLVPWTLSSYGNRTSAAAGARLWNSLLVQLHNPDITYGLFRQQLKGYLFGKHEHGTLTSNIRHLRKTLPYLECYHFT